MSECGREGHPSGVVLTESGGDKDDKAFMY